MKLAQLAELLGEPVAEVEAAVRRTAADRADRIAHKISPPFVICSPASRHRDLWQPRMR